MKHLALIVLLGACCGATAQPQYSVTLDANPPTPEDALLGNATLTLDGVYLSYELHLTGRWLGHLSPEMDPFHPPQPSITLEGAGSTSVPWLSASLEGPLDWSLARYTFTGAMTLPEAVVAELADGQSTLAVDYGLWGTVSGEVIPVPEPSPATLLGAGLVMCFLWIIRRTSRCPE
jgi:hypothetical protein